jgi:hypoxanthine phosphoribosyltransferase
MKIREVEFEKIISEQKIQKRVDQLAEEINRDYAGQTPLFLPVLNGAFLFAGDLLRKIKLDCRVSFVKHTSYQGTASSGQLKTLIGLQESVFNQDLIIIEDIVDTGLTIQMIKEELSSLGARSIEVVALMKKKKAENEIPDPKYLGFTINEDFVVGYGLDYDGYGRNLRDIYQQTPQVH